jgi:hypothetical protein
MRNTLIRVTRLYNNPILDSKGIYIPYKDSKTLKKGPAMGKNLLYKGTPPVSVTFRLN